MLSVVRSEATIWNNEAIITDALCKAPEVFHSSGTMPVHFCRWRQFVGSYSVPALPYPMFVVQLAGKPDVRYWDRDGWSEATAFPGAASIIPAGRETRWLVDGELDVVTFSLEQIVNRTRSPSRFSTMRFAYSDPLGAALAEQILGELMRAPGERDDGYMENLFGTLAAHVASDRSGEGKARYPTSGTSSFRIHKVMNAIAEDPAAPHRLDELADLARVNKSHLCRIFKQSVGTTLHSYLLGVRLERARQLLAYPDLSIAQVAEMSGFAGSSQFTRAFRSHHHETPTSYRTRMLGKAA